MNFSTLYNNRIFSLTRKILLFSPIVILLAFILISTEVFASNNQLFLQEDERPFITIWKTDNPGSSNANQIIIPTDQTVELGLVYDYAVYWEEVGNPSNYGSATGLTNNVTIDFPATGIYRVEVTGIFPKIFFNNAGDRSKILAVEQWGNIIWEDMRYSFWGCNNISINATDAPDLSQVTDLWGMFRESSINQNINHWDVSNVTNIGNLFRDAKQFNQELSEWDVSNVTMMPQVFMNADKFNQDISSWDVSNVTNMGAMFSGASHFNQDIGNWNVENVSLMNAMFQAASHFNQDISNWDVSNVTDMSLMFRVATNFNQPIGKWNTSKVNKLNRIFNFASNFNGDIGTWDISNVTDLSSIFSEAISFNQDISNWSLSQVVNTSFMLYGAISFDQDLSSWDINNVINIDNMLKNSGISPYNYDLTLEGWVAKGVQNGLNFQAHGLKYCQGEDARNELISLYGWIMTGDTKECNQGITFTISSPKVFNDPDFKLNGKVSSGTAVHYTSSNQNVAIVSNDTLLIKGVGTTTITASQPGNAYYNMASPINRELKVTKADQTIVFEPLLSRTIGDDDFELTATVESGLGITFVSSNESVATIVGKTVTIVGEGTTIITATQEGNENYNAAIPVDQTLIVNKREQVITFLPLQARTILEEGFDLKATASSGLDILFTSSDESVAIIQDHIVSIVGVGTTTITAFQTGNTEYLSATEVSQELTITKSSQSIVFEPLMDRPSDYGDFDLVATASSGLEIAFSISGPATLEGKIVTLKGTSGIVTVTASQAGDDIYNSADPVTRSFEVIAVTGVEDFVKEGISIYPNPVVATLTIEFGQTDGGIVFVYDAKGKVVLQQSLSTSLNKLDLADLSNGLYFIKIQLADKELYHKVVKE